MAVRMVAYARRSISQDGRGRTGLLGNPCGFGIARTVIQSMQGSHWLTETRDVTKDDEDLGPNEINVQLARRPGGWTTAFRRGYCIGK